MQIVFYFVLAVGMVLEMFPEKDQTFLSELEHLSIVLEGLRVDRTVRAHSIAMKQFGSFGQRPVSVEISDGEEPRTDIDVEEQIGWEMSGEEKCFEKLKREYLPGAIFFFLVEDEAEFAYKLL
jgi:hypothetical protein